MEFTGNSNYSSLLIHKDFSDINKAISYIHQMNDHYNLTYAD